MNNLSPAQRNEAGRETKHIAAFLLAPLAAGPIAGPLYSEYLFIAVGRPFQATEFRRGAIAFGLAVTVVAYIATALVGGASLWYTRRNRSAPSFPLTVLAGTVAGAIAPECIPWVWVLQGPIGSPLFVVHVALGAVCGTVVAALFWTLALRPPVPNRAHAFATRYFAGCPAHIEEARAVHDLIERLSRKGQPDLDPNVAIGEIVELRPKNPQDSLGVVESVMAAEELLGPYGDRSGWAADTLPTRSIRSIVNERVRLRGDCSCP